jgi:hypothetical protein
MLQFDESKLNSLAVHHVGNKTLDEGVRYSQELVNINDEHLVKIVYRYFLTSFSGKELYHFSNDVGLEQNEVFVLAKRIFESPDEIFQHSKTVSLHLYNCSKHPKVKKGELYVSYFQDILIDDEITDAVGIFKSETKDDFIKVDINNSSQTVNYHEGVNVNKLDKGCLILNLDKEQGYRVCINDNITKSSEVQYWKDDFLQLQSLNNDYNQTNNFLGITKRFLTKQITNDVDISKSEQIDLLNKSVDYFKTHESFDKADFEKEVLSNDKVIESFRSFDETYRTENEIELTDNFEISPQAVKKQARAFKRVLKLDENFDILIKGDKDLIEKGIEEDGRKYYKIYYDEEK